MSRGWLGKEAEFELNLDRVPALLHSFFSRPCLLLLVGRVMSARKLPKVADVEVESHYGFVFGVSGPG